MEPKSLIPEEFKLYSEVEELAWSCNKESLDKIKEYIPKLDHIYLQSLILFVAQRTYVHYDLYEELFIKIPKTSLKMHPYSPFTVLLYSKGHLTSQDFKSGRIPEKLTEEQILATENPIASDPILSAIAQDDVNKFSFLITPNDTNLDRFELNLPMRKLSFLQFAFYMGSLNIVKYLLLNGATISDIALEWAIAGGHEATIEFLSAKDFHFEKKLIFAVGYHNNNVAHWLIDNYQCEHVKLPLTVECFNTEMFFFLMQKSPRIDETFQSDRTSLIFAVEYNYLPMIIYLLEKGANPMILDAYDYPALHYAHSNQVRDLLIKVTEERKKTSPSGFFKMF